MATAQKQKAYTEAVGRRKTAVARVRLSTRTGANTVTVNGKSLEAYFPLLRYQKSVLKPFETTRQEKGIEVSVVVRGGGISMQSEAVCLGIARALLAQAESDTMTRAHLKKAGLLTRDSRAVERKKPGLKKARRAPQWAKR